MTCVHILALFCWLCDLRKMTEPLSVPTSIKGKQWSYSPAGPVCGVRAPWARGKHPLDSVHGIVCPGLVRDMGCRSAEPTRSDSLGLHFYLSMPLGSLIPPAGGNLWRPLEKMWGVPLPPPPAAPGPVQDGWPWAVEFGTR